MGSPPHLPRVQPNGGWVGELSDRRPRRERTVAKVVDARATHASASRTVWQDAGTRRKFSPVAAGPDQRVPHRDGIPHRVHRPNPTFNPHRTTRLNRP